MPTDHYAALGISRTATTDEIKKAWRDLIKKHHPDKGGNAEKFKAVQEAYEVLSNPEKRREYDDPRLDPSNLAEDLWKHFTSASHAFRQTSNDRWGFKSQAKRGADIHFTLNLTFEEMCMGCVQHFTVTRRVRCPECKGEGGQDFTPCEYCGGKGKGGYSECGVCMGKGKIPRKTCIQCAGSGLAPKQQQVKLTLPAGVQPDSMCDLEGYGHEVLDGESGDLQVRIAVRHHDFFRRSGFDITCTLKVNAIRAILGGEVTVKTIHGERTLVIPAGTQNGHTAILEGEGIHVKDQKGNQNVRIKIVIPVLDAEEKGALTELLIDKIIRHSPEAELEPLREAIRW